MNAAVMNSMQRTLTALGQKEPDRVPLFLLTTLHGARELNLSIEDYFSSADHVVEGQMRLLKKYRSDCLYAFFHASIETEAWGGTTLYLPDGPPLCGAPVIQRPQDIDRLQSPHIASCAALTKVLTAIHSLKQRVGDTVPIVGVAISPFSLPVMQMGFHGYLELMHEQPERFEALMKVNEAFTVAWANAQLEAGATAICYFDPVASSTIIPRALYQTTGMRVAQRTVALIKGPTATHMASGRALAIVDDLVSTGTAVIGVSAQEDLAQWKQAAAGRINLMGNLNGVEMRRWTPEQAENEVKIAIAKAARGGGFILADNHGEIPWQVSEEVLLAIGDAVQRWGRYPLDWVADHVCS
jgi:uroporphyrinogen decarboxylase